LATLGRHFARAIPSPTAGRRPASQVHGRAIARPDPRLQPGPRLDERRFSNTAADCGIRTTCVPNPLLTFDLRDSGATVIALDRVSPECPWANWVERRTSRGNWQQELAVLGQIPANSSAFRSGYHAAKNPGAGVATPGWAAANRSCAAHIRWCQRSSRLLEELSGSSSLSTEADRDTRQVHRDKIRSLFSTPENACYNLVVVVRWLL
jgi:hypothetical protein